MFRKTLIGLNVTFTLLILGITAKFSFAVDDPWADEVVAYYGKNQNLGFTNPQSVLGPPLGFGASLPALQGVYSIGTPGIPQESYIIVKFNTPVKDDPQNPLGLDCIVYSNAFWVGGDMKRKFIEPGLIEISKDVNKNGLPDDPWYVIPGSRGLSRSIFPQGITTNTPPFAGIVTTSTNEEVVWGYADVNPTMPPYRDNYLRPDNPRSIGIDPGTGGGDAFDIAWAVDENGNPANLAEFDFIRVSTISNLLDPVYGFLTTEVMAFADVAPLVDSDGDGVLDEYEIRVSGTDPLRPESTVLPLEIPIEWGGSPAGTELGRACTPNGTLCVAIFSNGARTGTREYNCIVDLQVVPDPSNIELPGLRKGNLYFQFFSSLADFQLAQVAFPKITIHYTANDISGLDEQALQVYRWDGNRWTIEEVQVLDRDLTNNSVVFQTRYPGVFGLFSVPGTGDITPEQGYIRLTANRNITRVKGFGENVVVIGDNITDPENQPVPDGTLFTVSASLFSVLNPDEDHLTEGIQVSTRDGKLIIELEPGQTAGKGKLSVQNLENTIKGDCYIDILPGPPGYVSNVWYVGMRRNQFDFITDQIHDMYGNAIVSGFITVDVQGGYVITPDALPGTPGIQIAISNGRSFFSVRPLSNANPVWVEVCISDEEGLHTLLCREFGLEFKQLPLVKQPLLFILLISLGTFIVKRKTC